MKLLLPLLATLAACEHYAVALLDQTHSALSKHAEVNDWAAGKLGYSRNMAQALVDRLDEDINKLYGETNKFAIAGGNSLANYLDVSSVPQEEHEPILIIIDDHAEFDQQAIYRARTLREMVTPEMRAEKLAHVVKDMMESLIGGKVEGGLQKRVMQNPHYCNNPHCPVWCPGCLIQELSDGTVVYSNTTSEE